MVSVIIVCAGNSERMAQEGNKNLLLINEIPVFMHSVNLFKNYSDDVIVVCKEEEKDFFLEYYDNVVIGGKSRTDSVYNGIKASKYDDVLIHDGARPNIKASDVEKLISNINEDTTLFLGSYISDTVKNLSLDNVKREEYTLAYTPQFVKKSDYLKAYSLNKEQTTDDVSFIKKVLEKETRMVEGRKDNFKITTKEDYYLVKAMMEQPVRIGHSNDIHVLVPERRLVLAGISIPYEKGLLGHSDADVVLHAVSEAFLGALGLRDLGYYYPDNSPKTLDMDSTIILKECYDKVLNNGFIVGNIDIMIYAEEPKLSGYIEAMKENISKLINIPASIISIKATTREGLGQVGHKEAIACDATVLLYKK